MDKRLVLYQSIADNLRTQIMEGAENTFLPSERELAAKYGVERLTIRRALKVLSDEGLVQRIRGKGTIVNKPQMQQEPRHYSEDLNVLFALSAGDGEKIKQPYMANLFYRLEKLLFHDGFNLKYVQIGPKGNMLDFAKVLSSVSGVIFYSKVDLQYINLAIQYRVPTLLVSNVVPGVPAILYDNINGTYDAVSHLIDAGCKRVAFISGAEDYLNAQQRLEGYIRALATHGLPYDPDMVIGGRWDFESGRECTEELIGRGIRFDGIMAANDMIALGAMRALSSHSITVPGQVRVVGFDNIESGEFSTPSLSTVSVCSKTVAWTAMAVLKRLIDGDSMNEALMIPANLIIRESSST